MRWSGHQQRLRATPDPEQLYAALDLGTNSCRMLIARPKGGQFEVVDSFSKAVERGTRKDSGLLSGIRPK